MDYAESETQSKKSHTEIRPSDDHAKYFWVTISPASLEDRLRWAYRAGTKQLCKLPTLETQLKYAIEQRGVFLGAAGVTRHLGWDNCTSVAVEAKNFFDEFYNARKTGNPLNWL